MTGILRPAPPAPNPSDKRRRSPLALVLLGLLSFVLFVALLSLGTWQVQRLHWKLALIARVEARVHAPATDAPAPADWPTVTAEGDEYRHVRITGSFRHDKETLTQALTALGPGFWVMTPLIAADGTTVLVNRGFVPEEKRDPATRVEGQVTGPVTVTGLLRITEPGGGFLRSNDPAADRWYSRDVQAIAAARGLGNVAPYFIDADATLNPGGYPVGGLTVIDFPNSHLSYAITWYGMALLLAGAVLWIGRDEWRQRRGPVAVPGTGVRPEAGGPDGG